MIIRVEISEREIRAILSNYLQQKGIGINPDEITIEVKSKQNYKSEWEKADFRAIALKTGE